MEKKTTGESYKDDKSRGEINIIMGRYKAVFSDIDGTLLDSTHMILPDTKQKIQEINRKGIPFILVSARMPRGMTGIRDELGIRMPMVCYSGALVVDEKGEILFSRNIELHMADQVYRSIQKEKIDISFSLYSGNRWIASDPGNPWIRQESFITGVKPEIGDFTDLTVFENIHKILCMGEPGKILRLERMLQVKFPKLSAYRSKDTYLEIMSDQASKSNAVSILEMYLGISRQEVIAFGDGHNDKDMLAYAGLGIAMGNASEEVRKSADLVTDTNDREGLKKALDKYF